MPDKEKRNVPGIGLKKRAMLTALKSNLGNISAACDKIGITRQCHYLWIEDDEDYKTDYENIRETAVDFAESSLMKNIKDGKETSTIFFLKTRGKDRGYIEQQDFKVDLNKELPDWINEV